MIRLFKIMQKDNEKGFTLVELMIVVAIIGILAAIAIPQFAAYRIRAYNTSAESDVKNISTSEAAFFADWQAYGQTTTAAAAAALAAVMGADSGAITTGPGGATTVIGDYISTAGRSLQIGIGNGVSIVANTTAGMGDFNAIAKHLQGDTYWAADSNVTALFFDQVAGSAGTILAAAIDAAYPSTAADDFTGVAGPSANNWVVK